MRSPSLMLRGGGRGVGLNKCIFTFSLLTCTYFYASVVNSPVLFRAYRPTVRQVAAPAIALHIVRMHMIPRSDITTG